ncbi:cell division ATPase MinD [Candidatus Woesearchaeota archaeon]|nr:cell division ATPase MinD [Candidatus Woesearchaeota archaeon]
MTRFLSIASGKGGVGKTTAAINLGTALSSLGVDVMVVDGNLRTPNLGLYLGVSNIPATLHDAMKGTKGIAEAVYIHSSGLKIVPAGISLNDTKNIDFENFKNVMLDLYGTADLVLIDVGAGISEEALSAIKASEEMIIVVTPDSASIADGIKILNVAKENGVGTRGVIINKNSESSDFSRESIAALFGVPVMAEIPEEPEFKKSVSIKQPLVFLNPENPASIAYKKLAAELIGQKYEAKVERKSFFAKFFSKKQ